METIVAGLILAAVSALGVLAYRHPGAYAKIFVPLLMIATGVTLIGLGWALGSGAAFYSVASYIDIGKWEAAKQAVADYSPPPWAFFLNMAFIAYLLFLAYLPTLIDRDR